MIVNDDNKDDGTKRNHSNHDELWYGIVQKYIYFIYLSSFLPLVVHVVTAIIDGRGINLLSPCLLRQLTNQCFEFSLTLRNK